MERKASNAKTRLLRTLIDCSYELQPKRLNNFSFSVWCERMCWTNESIQCTPTSSWFHRQYVRVRKPREMGHTYSFQLRALNVNVFGLQNNSPVQLEVKASQHLSNVFFFWCSTYTKSCWLVTNKHQIGACQFSKKWHRTWAWARWTFPKWPDNL